MKGQTTVDFHARQVRIEVTLEALEDAGAAMEMIRNAARACWPNIMFNDETLDEDWQAHESFATPEAPAPDEHAAPNGEAWVMTETAPGAAPRVYNHANPPKPGSLSEKVLQACRRLNTDDYRQIRDALDIHGGAAARIVAHLKRGGHLEDLACN